MLRRAFLFAACATAIGYLRVRAAEDVSLAGFSRVIVAPSKTSVYVGSVSMTMTAFARLGGSFEASYVAKVFPYFFYNESGRLTVDMPDDALRQLARGEAIEFKGRAVNDDGKERRVEGKATPTDLATGKLKVRVFYSKRIELIFNTSYQFPDAANSGGQSAAAK